MGNMHSCSAFQYTTSCGHAFWEEEELSQLPVVLNNSIFMTLEEAPHSSLHTPALFSGPH